MFNSSDLIAEARSCEFVFDKNLYKNTSPDIWTCYKCNGALPEEITFSPMHTSIQ